MGFHGQKVRQVGRLSEISGSRMRRIPDKPAYGLHRSFPRQSSSAGMPLWYYCEVDEAEKKGSSPGTFVLVVLLVLGLLYAPLAVSIVEGTFFHSRRFEDFFEKIGIHKYFMIIYHFTLSPFYKLLER